MKNPCMNCEKAGCGVYHDQCEPYQQYRKYHNDISKARAKARKELQLTKAGAIKYAIKKIKEGRK